jgi:hypothetical protein
MYAATVIASISWSSRWPVEELFHRARIGSARVAVTDVRGKEFDEAAAGAFALSTNDCRQRIESGSHERGRRYDFVG